MRILTTALAVTFLAGCSLPGYHIDADSDSAWYGTDPRHAGADTEEPIPDYDVETKRITPTLIHKLRTQRQAELKSPLPIEPAEDPYPAYRVGPGDLINVIVYGHPDLTNPTGTTQNIEASGRLVDAQGEIFFPFVGEVEVEGMTVDEIRTELTEGLSGVLRDPQVDVRVLRFRSKQVFISGDISKPCTVPITDIPLTVVEALDSCQGLASREQFGARALRLIRDGESIPLDLGKIHHRRQPFWLQGGDHLVIDDRLNRVFLIGEFEKQTTAQIAAGGMTLADAMSEAGGLNQDTADASKIFVIRGFVDEEPAEDGSIRTNLQPTVYHLNAKSAESLILADQFELKPRDVVYAAPAGLVNFNRALALITPSLNTLFQTTVSVDRLSD